MIPTMALHLADLEQRIAVVQLSIQGLCTVYATDATARADFAAVVHDATKLRSHVQGVRIECEYAEGRK